MKTFYATPENDLQSLIDSCRNGDVIYLSEGIFRQKIEIDTNGITLIGNGKTVIANDDYAKKLDENGVEFNTFRTYTVAVCANDVTLQNLQIINDAHDSPHKGQEVAISVCGTNFVAQNCTFVSEQDTVFCGPLPDDLIERYDGFLKAKLRKKGSCKQRFLKCKIVGTVDFVFGCADALFDECDVVSSTDGRTGFVAAPAHSSSQQIGFVFLHCNFVCDENMPEHTVFLARPWRDFGKASFVDCNYGAHIKTEGFDKWNDTDRDKTARFAETNKSSQRVSWSKSLDERDVKTLLDYFNDTEKQRFDTSIVVTHDAK